jgi:putative ABC transport system ATP-binding protein
MRRSDTPVIRLSGITKVFHAGETETETTALREVDLDVMAGEFVSVAGPSGCGKTTLLSTIGLLEPPTAGEYLLAGRSVTNLSSAERAHIRRRRIGFIFQGFNLIENLTVFENVELPLTYRSLRTAERRARVHGALERVGMAHRPRHFPSQLSGGQQQRVAVARAVAGDPMILLADEPTGNLDSQHGEAIMALLSELHAAGATVCLVTHDERFMRHAERVVHLHDGRVVGEERPSHAPRAHATVERSSRASSIERTTCGTPGHRAQRHVVDSSPRAW